MKIDKDDLTNCIEQIIAEAVIEGEEVDVTTSRIVKFVWPIIEYLKKIDPVVMPTEECVKQWYVGGKVKDWRYWRNVVYPSTDAEVVNEIMKALKYFMITWQNKPKPEFTDEDILDEMEADMNQWGVAQGEIESMRQDWRNRFFIVRREGQIKTDANKPNGEQNGSR